MTDKEGVTDTDTVTVSVTNRRPTANAGPDLNVAWNDSVTLDGSRRSNFDEWHNRQQLPTAPVPLAAEVGSADGGVAGLQQRPAVV